MTSAKVKTLVRAPALTSSGYGVHSRQVIFALLNDPTIDLYLEEVPWGGCAYLTDKSQETRILKELSQRYQIAKQQKQDDNFGLFISITIPQEFERRGAINIGVTAASETDRCSGHWLQKCNEMDVIIVPSVHAQRNLCNPILNWENSDTGEQGELKLERPCVVCPEGFDSSIFKSIPELETRVAKLKFTADFNFLVVGQWGNGTYGEDRKNIANTIRYFIQAFYGRKDVGLVLKVNLARNSRPDEEAVIERITQIKSNFEADKIPPIHLLHRNLSDQEMGELYNHPQIKGLLTLTQGEGFGLPILEAAASGLPIIATNWSGHLDFLKDPKDPERLFSAVEYTLQEIPDAAVWEPVLIKDSRWAVPVEEDAIRRMVKFVDSYEKPKYWAKKLQKFVNETFELVRTQKYFLKVINEIRAQNAGSELTTTDSFQTVIDDPEAYNILYTMPMSTGDVFISTAVIDGVIKDAKKANEKVHLYFATAPKYHDVLKDNPNVHKVVNWQDNMMDFSKYHDIFDLVLTPNVATQFMFSNWIRNGHGRLLAEEFANHCQSDLGDYFIAEDDSVFTDVVLTANGEIDLRHEQYITFHPGSGKEQWEARKYVEWREALVNLKKTYPTLKIVQVGGSDEPSYAEADIDMRGHTNVHQLAALIKGSKLHLSIDTFTMHLAASYHVPLVALFGSSHAGSTGPWYRDPENESYILLESQEKMGCKTACYKYQCKVNRDLPCINEIDSSEVVKCVSALLKNNKTFTLDAEEHEYERVFGTISAYTTSFNAVTMGYPFVECISSMLGFADEVVVVDHSTDGTYEILEKMAQDEPRIQLYKRVWDPDCPTQDGDSKAYARALCCYDFCWQQDLDEVVHERDYEKIKWITKRFPSQADILHLPVVECWGDAEHATGRRHSWKWRMSRNLPNITHGVNQAARVTDPDTGKLYAKEGMSDGCEMVDQITFQPLPHVGFYTDQIEQARVSMPEQYEKIMNAVIERVPSIYHYSWASLPLKIKQFQVAWDRQWSSLYQKEMPPRFPSDCDVAATVKELYEQGGERSDEIKYKYKLEASHPAVMQDWLDECLGKLKATG